MKEHIQVRDLSFELYLSAEQIQERILVLAQELNLAYADKCPLFIGVLNGAFMFAADLMKVCDFDCEISFIKVASYRGMTSTGEVSTVIGLDKEIKGRHVIIVEDIIDTGNTMTKLMEDLTGYEPASMTLASLLLKPEALQHPHLPMGYIGFEIPNKFVLGYGLDYDGLGRNYPDIYQLVK